MAAVTPADFNEDDFEDFNPHPYQGGYDIIATYGPPLPPSTAICYPRPNQHALPVPTHAPPVHDKVKAEPEFHEPKSEFTLHDYGLMEKYEPEVYPSPDLFRNWPYSNWREREIFGGNGVEDGAGFFNWRKGLDYLFGHDVGYGERLVGVDSYGIPVYAFRKNGGEEGVVVEVEPPEIRRVEYSDSGYMDSWPRWHGHESDENYGITNYAHNKHYLEEPLAVEVNPYDFHEKVHSHGVSVEQPRYSEYSTSNEESSFMTSLFGSPNIAYNRHVSEQAQHFYVKPVELFGSEKIGYQDVYQEASYLESRNFLSYHDERVDEANYFTTPVNAVKNSSYEEHEGHKYDPFQVTWLQNEENYSAKVEDPLKSHFNSSLFDDQDTMSTSYGIPNFGYESHDYGQPLPFQLEPYKPSWSQYLSYSTAYGDLVYPISEQEDDSQSVSRW